MQSHPYWKTQSDTKPLYPNFEWNKPERLDQAGKLAIIGGNKLSFAGVAEAYQTAGSAGAGQVRAVLPESLKASIPPLLTDIVYAADNASGGLSAEAIAEIKAAANWSDVTLMIGDAGRNSETAVLYEQFLSDHTGKLVVSRDAVDLLLNGAQNLVERPDTLLVVSFAQAQKLFRAVYYPKVLTFNMQLMQLVEALHKFTITYPVALAVLHNDSLLVAQSGDVNSQPWDAPMDIWRGKTAARAATYWLWDKSPLTATTASLASK